MNELLKKDDRVVMHTCAEAYDPNNEGKIWTCKTDEFTRGTGVYEQHLVFLEGFSDSFDTKYLQRVDVASLRINEEAQYDNKRESIAKFADEMELRLRENDFKGGWQGTTLEFLCTKMNEKILMVNSDSTWKEVMSESINIANYAMMLFELAVKELQRSVPVMVLRNKNNAERYLAAYGDVGDWEDPNLDVALNNIHNAYLIFREDLSSPSREDLEQHIDTFVKHKKELEEQGREDEIFMDFEDVCEHYDPINIIITRDQLERNCGLF